MKVQTRIIYKNYRYVGQVYMGYFGIWRTITREHLTKHDVRKEIHKWLNKVDKNSTVVEQQEYEM